MSRTKSKTFLLNCLKDVGMTLTKRNKMQHMQAKAHEKVRSSG